MKSDPPNLLKPLLNPPKTPLFLLVFHNWISLLEISQFQGILQLDFCYDTTIEPPKKCSKGHWAKFQTAWFGTIFCSKKCYFWPFLPNFSAPNFKKMHLLTNGNVQHSKKFWENWCRKSCKKWPKQHFLAPKQLFFAILVCQAVLNCWKWRILLFDNDW